ncbi:AP2 domain transcription factor ap2ix-7 [Babesia caballi]|uniref:AP2 domain transcription factor ap2ix-7 n=1 Tax=Babesia caballi TaxID=5871 RepID=A0AAV4LUM0_BABCB|nr:AP2 domain transcription factor ap2ix-7 [Babesia caballi]
MAFDHFESSVGTEFSSHCRQSPSPSQDDKEMQESDCATSDYSYVNTHSFPGRHYGAGYTSDSTSMKLPEFSDVGTPLSASGSVCGRDLPKVVKTKTIRDLECEESLRRLHSLAVGESVYFRRSLLSTRDEGDTPEVGDYVEGKVACFSYDMERRYVVVALDGYGFLKFTFGDLYAMSIERNAFLQRLHSPGALAKSLKHKRQRLDFEDEYMTRRSNSSHMGMLTEDSDSFTATESPYAISYKASNLANAHSSPDSVDVRTRPVPPGAEVFCRCRFINKVDFVRKLRAIISQNKQHFFEITEGMQELRLIMTQNIRAYELEMVAYLLGEDPWSYSANPYDRPTPEQVNDIVEQYSVAARNPEYMTLFAQWSKYQKLLKSEAKAAATVMASSPPPRAAT